MDASVPPALRPPPIVEILDWPAMQAHAGAWDELLSRAVAPSPFASHAVIAAHAEAGIGRAPRVLAARRGDRLVALLPLSAGGVRFGARRRAGAWTSPYAVASTPLIDAGEPETALAALLDGLALAAGTGPFAWPLLPLDDPAGAALMAGLARRGWPHAVEGAFSRPVLDRRADYEAYEATLGRGRRRSLRRLGRRLAETGALAHRCATEGEALASAVEAFLALEAAGWKGRGGTALAADPRTAAFARRLFRTQGGPVRARADLLTLDGRPIAASLALVCGGTAHLLKTAYDETLRRFAPGLVLEDAIVRALHRDGFARRLDSASLPGGVLDELYPDRERVGDLLLAPGGMDEASFRRLLAVERLRRAGRQGLKRLSARLAS